MKNKSRKAKSRYLQNLVRDRIVKLYPALTKKDIRTSNTGENGSDVKLLTHIAKKLFNYSVECKNRKDLKMIFSFYKQASSHGTAEPLLIIKSNGEKPLAIIDMEHLFKLQEND